jgi:hypothetical protein
MEKRMSYRSLLLAGSILATAAPGAGATEQAAWRLFVADHAEPIVNVIDAADGRPIDRFEIEAPATLYPSESARTVFAVQRDGDVVEAFSSGITVDDHGDHGDLSVSPPARLDGRIGGDRPVHFVAHDGLVALFFDGEGIARVIGERDMANEDVTFRQVATPAPHHGLAAPFGKHLIVSVPDPEDPSQLPVGVEILDASNQRHGDMHPCPGLHGEAASSRVLAIACDTGLLIARAGATPQMEHLPYAEGLPDGKVSTLVGGRGLQYFLGNFGPDRIVLIDPDEEDAFRLVDLPTRRVHFAVDPVRPKFAYVLTEDGDLHRLDVLSGEIVDSITVTEPYSMDGHWSDPRPRIAIAGDAVMVTDPLRSRIHRIDAESFRPDGDIAVDGTPFNIVAIGGSGTVHGEEAAHDAE